VLWLVLAFTFIYHVKTKHRISTIELTMSGILKYLFVQDSPASEHFNNIFVGVADFGEKFAISDCSEL